MPQFYRRKTNRAIRTPPDVMSRAADDVVRGRSLRSVAEAFGIDKMTLSRFIAKRKNNPNAITGYAAVAHAHYVIPQQMEEDLGNHVKRLADMFFGLSLETVL
ncbi:uncharacterized protein LOC144421901 [Styela clava]